MAQEPQGAPSDSRVWRRLAAGQRLSAYRALPEVRGGRQPVAKMTFTNWLKDRGWEAHVEKPAQVPASPAQRFVPKLGPDGKETPLWRALVSNGHQPLLAHWSRTHRAEGWVFSSDLIAAAEARVAPEPALGDARKPASRTAA